MIQLSEGAKPAVGPEIASSNLPSTSIKFANSYAHVRGVSRLRAITVFRAADSVAMFAYIWQNLGKVIGRARVVRDDTRTYETRWRGSAPPGGSYGQDEPEHRHRRPPEAVFDMIADIEKSAARIEGIEKIEMLTEGPVGVGTKWRETRLMMKKEAVEEMEITAFERPTYYTVYCDSCGYDMEWTMHVEPRGDGSTLTLDMTSKARTFIGKLMTPLGWLMAGMMKKCVVKDLDNIKAYIEKQGALTPAGD